VNGFLKPEENNNFALNLNSGDEADQKEKTDEKSKKAKRGKRKAQKEEDENISLKKAKLEESGNCKKIGFLNVTYSTMAATLTKRPLSGYFCTIIDWCMQVVVNYKTKV